MDNTYTPLVSDNEITQLAAMFAQAQTGNYQENWRAYECGAKAMLAVAEAERRQTHAELSELRAENERMREAGDAMAVVLTKHAAQCGTPDMGEVEAVQSWEATRKTDQQLYAEAEQNIPQESFDRIEKGILAVDRLDELKTAIEGLPRFTECSNGQFVLRTDVLELLADQPSTKDTE